MTPSHSSPAPDQGAGRPSVRSTVRKLGALALVVVLGAACYKLETTAPGSGTTFVFKSNPCASPDTVQLAVNATQRVDCGNGGTTVTFAGAGASYLIVPEFATDQAIFQFVQYAVDSGGISASAPNARVSASMRARPGLGTAAVAAAVQHGAAQRIADGRLRSRGRRMATASAFRTSRAMGLRASRGAVRMTSVPAQGSVRSFQVLSNLFGPTDTWAAVAAQLAYVGANVLLYVDTLAPAGGFTPSQLQSYGQYFDQTLFPIDTTAFGAPSDIDANGRVIVLMSNVVNADTPASTCSTQGYVAGFFNEEDFATAATDPHSNQGEIFYTILPDPNGQLSCAHSLADLESVVPPTFLHELQHLVNFSQHVVVAGGAPGASWLDEGLSIAAEELGSLYYERKCPPPSCRTDPSQLFPDSSESFVQGFLYDSYQFALLPDTASITLENDGDPGVGWRGGEWLLVRWLADQKGSGLYRQLELGPSDGVADIAQAMGEPFPRLFADFGLALYTDSLPGLPRSTAPAANRFSTRNLSQMWARLFANSGPSPDIPLAMPVQLFPVTSDTSSAIMYPGTVTYFRLDTPANAATVSVRFAGPLGTSFPGGLQPQLAIFRLPPGQ